jgi:hypothetical protein
MQGLSETYQILREDANGAPTRAINIGDKKEGDAQHNWQNQQANKSLRRTVRRITDQQARADGHGGYQTPRPNRTSIPPGGLRVSLRVQYIVHS